MPSINDVYTSKFIKGSDLQRDGQPLSAKLTIINIEITQLPDNGKGPRNQLVLHFANTDKQLGLNATNARVLGAMYGEDYSQWGGKQVHMRGLYKSVAGSPMWVVDVFDPRAFSQTADFAQSAPPAPAAAPRPAPAAAAPALASAPALPPYNDFGGDDRTPVQHSATAGADETGEWTDDIPF